MEWSPRGLVTAGFTGFVPFIDLPAQRLPSDPGVYVVLRVSPARRTFIERSTAGWFKDKDPSVPIARLEAAWLDGTPVLYIGKATSLRARLAQYRQHGEGRKIGHWGGRFIWQLADSVDLLVAWKPTPEHDPRDVERELIADFVRQFGARPFANLKG